MVVHEHALEGGRVVSLEVWDGLYVVVVMGLAPGLSYDVATIDEFVSLREALVAYRSAK